jgi:hypothetical protein
MKVKSVHKVTEGYDASMRPMSEIAIGTAAFIAITVFAACGSDGASSAGTGGIGGVDGTGGNGGEPESNATINEAVMRDTATAALSAAQITVAGDGEAGAFELLDVGTSAVELLTPEESERTTLASTESFERLKQGEGCECTENSCTFNNCDRGTGLLLSGSISWTDTTLDCDYSVAGNSAGATYSFSVFCDLDYTDTSLDGQLNTRGSVELAASGQVSTWDTQMTFNNVTYTGGQPTGGSIDVSASVMVGGETFTANLSVEF